MGEAQKVVFIWPSCRNFQTSFGPPWNIVENPCCIPSTTEECQIVGKQFSMGEELSRLDDVGMRMHFIPYRKTFSHNLALLRPPRHESSLAAVSYRLGPSHTVLPKCWAYRWTGVILNLCAQVQVNKNGRRKPNRFKFVLKRYKTWVYTYWIRLGSDVPKLMMRYLKEFKPPMNQGFFLGGTGGSPHPAKILPIPPPSDTCPRFWTKACPPQPRFVPENWKNLNTFLC